MTSIVDSLVITLGLDAKNYQKNSKQVNQDLKNTKKNADDAAKSIKEIAGAVATLFAAFTAGKGLKEFITDLTDSNAQLERLSENLNTSVEDLNAFGNASKLGGGSTAAFQGTIRGLSREMTNLAITGESSILPYMRALNVQMGDSRGVARPMTDILVDVASALQKLPRQEAFNIGQMMHIDEGTLNTMLEGGKAFKDLIDKQKKISGLTKEQTENSKRLYESLTNTQTKLGAVGRELAGYLTPALLSFSDAVGRATDWLEKHKAILIGVASILTVMMIPAIISATTALWALVAPWIALNAPILLIAAAISAVIAVVAVLADDWMTWVNGGKSALGELLGKFDDFMAKIHKAKEALLHIWGSDSVKDKNEAVQDVKDIFNKDITGRDDPKSRALNFFISKGWTPAQAAGLVANLNRESGLNTSAIGDSGKARGIGQWHPDRQAAFKKWSGFDIKDSTLDQQLGFVNYELTKGNEKSAGARLRAATNAQQAGSIVSKYYERPADVVGEAALRGHSAQAILMAQNATSAGKAVVGSSSTSSVETHIQNLTIHTKATDAAGIARDLQQELQNRQLAYQGDTGTY